MADLGSGFIVVGFDGTAESAAALRWALSRAAGMQVPVKIVHCWPAASRQTGGRTPGTRAPSAQRRTEAVLAVERELAVVQSLVPAPPAIGLVFTSAPVRSAMAGQARRAAMLVLGASSPAVLTDPSLGPVAGPCLSRIGCPVVVVDRQGRTATAQPRHPALSMAG